MRSLVLGRAGCVGRSPALGVVLPGSCDPPCHPAMAPGTPAGRDRTFPSLVGGAPQPVAGSDLVSVRSAEGLGMSDLGLSVSLAVPGVRSGDRVGAGYADPVRVLPATVGCLLLGFARGVFCWFGWFGVFGCVGLVSRAAAPWPRSVVFRIRTLGCVCGFVTSAHRFTLSGVVQRSFSVR